ncbi:MAG: SGNH/GDSL hydrolase family protein [Desulforhopalus sp.]
MIVKHGGNIKTEIKKIVAVGDCNTLGIKEMRGNCFPERLGEMLGADVLNLGHTMATTREGFNILQDNLGDVDCLLIQYGLADCYRTFTYAPYVLYYPDNLLRKISRRLVKKYKKLCRKNGLNNRLGETNTVPPYEFETNLRKMIALSSAKDIVIVDILPNKRLRLNEDVIAYNAIIGRVCADFDHCKKVDLYDDFINNFDSYYMDETHSNAEGHDRIAQRILEELQAPSSDL